MKIIGEKINGTRKSVDQAIKEKDAEFIAALAKAQVEAGANLLDVNVGSAPDTETEDLIWLVGVVQDAVDCQLCLDSSRPEPLKAALEKVNQKPMINSISGEPKRLEEILPLAAANDCELIALALDEGGIPKTADARMEVVRKMIARTRESGLADERLYIDPLVLSIATDIQAGNITLEVIRRIREEFPEAHITMGLSNVSFGLPKRMLINRTFLTLAYAAGMDSAIVDPTEVSMREAILTVKMLLGEDRFCRNYTRMMQAAAAAKK
ncbi:5-methyltetrahydrofolate--homocysteine methyltransferase [Desulfatibacillum alkenivorans DSM 16219]|jgi:5-methyltetrahydrofolate--homocysteine methyltransferase|uniref:5-methyltetrahydrofolate--homocysteine methyltransferase n=1 Tax=Desulfatibacillum alkenivorans DSM 16219 TaxID=1121393 RepID=A0A1M6ZL81_9BACT|nr:dihydropteroate synthase [Desulfatibacillum alkenivorans]SHL31154.1 5-methyltetrahydrofolate--homocysteine methyltransferase [Desulfatibacillum alkenivorans DSM 16219]